MSWPEAIFCSIVALCVTAVFAVAIFAAILRAGASSRETPQRPEWPEYSRTTITTRPHTSVQPESYIDPAKSPGKRKEAA